MQGSKHSFSSIYTALTKTFSVSRIAYSGALAREARQRSTMGKKIW